MFGGGGELEYLRVEPPLPQPPQLDRTLREEHLPGKISPTIILLAERAQLQYLDL